MVWIKQPLLDPFSETETLHEEDVVVETTVNYATDLRSWELSVSVQLRTVRGSVMT